MRFLVAALILFLSAHVAKAAPIFLQCRLDADAQSYAENYSFILDMAGGGRLLWKSHSEFTLRISRVGETELVARHDRTNVWDGGPDEARSAIFNFNRVDGRLTVIWARPHNEAERAAHPTCPKCETIIRTRTGICAATKKAF